MLISAAPTNHFIGKCAPCVRPFRVTNAATKTDFLTHPCPDCNTPVKAERLFGTKTAMICHTQCMGAVGPSCECQCGGENHGNAFGVTVTGEMLAGSLAAYRAQVAKREAAAAERAQTKADRERAEFNAWAEDNRDIVEWLGNGNQFAWGSDDQNDFLYEMSGYTGRYAQRRALTPRQAAAVRRCMEARQRFETTKREREANAKPCPTGTNITITGKVIQTETKDNPFGPGARYTMTVECDGYQILSTIPAALANLDPTPEDKAFGLKGRTVEFTAHVEQSRHSESYGFAKRPRRAKLTN